MTAPGCKFIYVKEQVKCFVRWLLSLLQRQGNKIKAKERRIKLNNRKDVAVNFYYVNGGEYQTRTDMPLSISF